MGLTTPIPLVLAKGVSKVFIYTVEDRTKIQVLYQHEPQTKNLGTTPTDSVCMLVHTRTELPERAYLQRCGFYSKRNRVLHVERCNLARLKRRLVQAQLLIQPHATGDGRNPRRMVTDQAENAITAGARHFCRICIRYRAELTTEYTHYYTPEYTVIIIDDLVYPCLNHMYELITE